MSEPENTTLDERTVPLFPDHIGLEAKVAVVFGIFVVTIGLIGIFLPVGLEEPADPMNTPAHVKPEWYFLALYQILKYIPKGIGAAMPVILVGLLFLWPFLDKKPDKTNYTRIRGLIMLVIVVILVALTLWGGIS